jgi:hypothetical protein
MGGSLCLCDCSIFRAQSPGNDVLEALAQFLFQAEQGHPFHRRAIPQINQLRPLDLVDLVLVGCRF